MPERKKVIITGASSGIGWACAVRFAKEGWDVCATARRAGLLEQLLGELAPGEHFAVAGDYSDPTTAAQIDAQIRARWGRLEALVNNAGVYMSVPAIESPLEEWRKNFDILFSGGVLMTRLAVPWMQAGGRVIHVTSIHGERAEAGASSYSTAKAALNQYCRALALELAPRGILVNAIAPGFVRTPMSVVDGVNELDGEWFKKNYIEGHHLPLKRAGEPQEIAGVAFFLAGPDATYLTGQVITVDGGLTITF
jgi:NAD(P)-dependent dehydrogenase (short-subunit alcohol dehydrogenase family)